MIKKRRKYKKRKVKKPVLRCKGLLDEDTYCNTKIDKKRPLEHFLHENKYYCKSCIKDLVIDLNTGKTVMFINKDKTEHYYKMKVEKESSRTDFTYDVVEV